MQTIPEMVETFRINSANESYPTQIERTIIDPKVIEHEDDEGGRVRSDRRSRICTSDPR
jgi:hypothetical protein